VSVTDTNGNRLLYDDSGYDLSEEGRAMTGLSSIEMELDPEFTSGQMVMAGFSGGKTHRLDQGSRGHPAADCDRS